MHMYVEDHDLVWYTLVTLDMISSNTLDSAENDNESMMSTILSFTLLKHSFGF